MTQVQNVMRREFVVAAASDFVRDAERTLAGSHYIALLEGDAVIGILCGCDLRSAPAAARVGQCHRLRVLGIAEDAPLREAATLMHGRGAGCLAVFSADRRLVGLVTREDLRRAGVPQRLLSASICGSCGGDEHIRARGHREGIGFCASCLERAIAVDFETGGEG